MAGKLHAVVLGLIIFPFMATNASAAKFELKHDNHAEQCGHLKDMISYYVALSTQEERTPAVKEGWQRFLSKYQKQYATSQCLRVSSVN